MIIYLLRFFSFPSVVGLLCRKKFVVHTQRRQFIGMVIALLLVSQCILQPAIAQADENFSTDLETIYTINDGGRTRVEHKISITNLKPLFTVSQYALQVNSPNITDVSVTGPNNTQIPAEEITTETVSNIAISFADQVVGEGKKRTFTIAYTDPDAAVISGQVLEVAVPKIQQPADYNSYLVKLITPIRFGSPNKVNPENPEVSISESGVVTTFREGHFDGVNAIYGDQQFFDLTLHYHLDNPNSSDRLMQVALPPDTAFQRLWYTELDPAPSEMARDGDGNWIATYRVPAATTFAVTAKAHIKLSLEPDPEVVEAPPQAAHTQSDEYWSLGSSRVKEAAGIYKTPAEIYQFSADTLTYNYDLATAGNIRLGAEQALANPLNALCQEFTDVFIALARANEIPARRLTGYAYTQNTVLRPLSFVEDILHAWPEYYDSTAGRWIPVDPTWGNTSGGINYFDQLDLNHIVFAINGLSSQRPYPAGSYKLSNIESKDIEVKFGSFFQLPSATYEFRVESSPFSWLPFVTPPAITISNTSGRAEYRQSFRLESASQSSESGESLDSVGNNQDSLVFWPSDEITVETLLPFETYSQSLIALQPGLILPRRSTIQITNGSSDQTKTTSSYQEITIPVYPYFWRWFFNPYVVLGLVGGSISLALITGSVLVFRRRRQSALRR